MLIIVKSLLLSLLLLGLDLLYLFIVVVVISLPLLVLLLAILLGALVVESFSLELIEYLLHGISVLLGLSAGSEELESLFHLLLQFLSKGRGLMLLALCERVNTRCDRALVGQVTGDASLVLLACAPDEGRVEDETILGGLTTGLQGSEKGFLRTQDLDGRGGVLCKICQRARVRDKLRADHLTDKGCQVRGYCIHSCFQILLELLTELYLFNNSLSEFLDLDDISLRHVLSHGDLGSIDDLLSLILIEDNLSELFLEVIINVVALLNESYGLAEDIVVGDDPGQLGEVP